MDRDRVTLGPLQRGGLAAMPAGLLAFWFTVVSLDRSDGSLDAVLAVVLVTTVFLGLVGMWFSRVRAATWGAASGVVAGTSLAVLVAGTLLATST